MHFQSTCSEIGEAVELAWNEKYYAAQGDEPARIKVGMWKCSHARVCGRVGTPMKEGIRCPHLPTSRAL